MPDVRPDWKPAIEGGIGRKKPPRGWRTKGRKMATRQEWEAIRVAKLRECRICGTLVGPMEMHHLVPRSMGGDDLADNCVPLCAACHDCVTRNVPADLADLAEALTDSEYAYIVGKLGEGGIARLFNA